jgi:hypothetical protein
MYICIYVYMGAYQAQGDPACQRISRIQPCIVLVKVTVEDRVKVSLQEHAW